MNENTYNEAAMDQQSQTSGQGEVQRPGLIQIIWNRKWFVIGAVFLCLTAGLVYLAKVTPIYMSTSRLYVEQRGPKIITENEGVMTQSKNYLYTQCELLRSTPILASALEQPGVKDMQMFRSVDNRTGYLKRVLRAGAGKKDDIISVSCDSPYPQEAAQIVNAVVEAYITYHSTQKRSSAAEVLKILQKEKTHRDLELRQTLQEMMEFKKTNGELSFEDEQGNIVLQRLSKLSDALTFAQLETISAKAAYDTAKALQGEPSKIKQLAKAQHAGGVYVSAEDDESSSLRRELRLARQRLAEIRRDYSEDHPGLQAAAAKAHQLEKDLAEQDSSFAEAFVATASHRHAATQALERQLQSSYKGQLALAQKANIKAAEFAILKAELRRTEKMCDILDSRIKELNVTEDTGALNISILEVAKAAAIPYKPERTRTMAIALVLGLILGIGTALARDWMDQSLRSAEEVSAVLGISVLGVVPHINGKGNTPSNRGQRVHLAPQSDAAEAYRTVRTAVYFGVPDGEAGTLLITSPMPGEGKTTLASNLSIAMAQAGRRTLLIDADFRKPSQHTIFELKGQDGLSNVLAGMVKLDDVIRRTDVDSLDVLPCGSIPPNPADMLNSKSFATTLRKLSDRYDQIIIDSPPVLPVADSRILGAMCDATVLVLHAGKSTRKAAVIARDGLLSVGTQILGVVVNDVEHKRRGYGYSYYGGYGHYGYGYGRRSEQNSASVDQDESPSTTLNEKADADS